MRFSLVVLTRSRWSSESTIEFEFRDPKGAANASFQNVQIRSPLGARIVFIDCGGASPSSLHVERSHGLVCNLSYHRLGGSLFFSDLG